MLSQVVLTFMDFQRDKNYSIYILDLQYNVAKQCIMHEIEITMSPTNLLLYFLSEESSILYFAWWFH